MYQRLLITVLACAVSACTADDDRGSAPMASTEDAVATGNNGEFIIRVLATGEVDRVDPILSPGVPSRRTNAFFAVEGVTSSSTPSELETHATTAQDPFDTASYWIPELFRNGAAWHPGCTGTPPLLTCGSDPNKTLYARAYYLTGAGPNTVQLPRVVMATGYPNATEDPSLTDPTSMLRVHYTCGATPSLTTPDSAWPYDCDNFADKAFDGVVMFVDFPTCWNGHVSGSLNGEPVVQYIDQHVKLGVTNDLAYAGANGCPVNFKFRIPRVSLRVHSKIKNPATDGSIIRPSSCAGSSPIFHCQTQANSPTNVSIGLSTATGIGDWYTWHAEYIQSWQMGTVTDPFSTSPPPDQDTNEQPGTLNDLTEDCLDHPQTCSFQPRSDGSFIGG